MNHLPCPYDALHYKSSSGSEIEPKSDVKDLGVHVSADLKWTTHVNRTVESSKKTANWVLSVFSDRSADLMLTLFKTMVRSKLEYSSPVWNPSSIEEIQKLESVQRTFTSRIVGCKDLSYWERLKKLDLFSLQRRRERYLILHMWKIIHDKVPNDINIEHYQSGRLGVRCRIPNLPNSASRLAKSTYDSSFAVVGPKLWNILPPDINTIDSLESFKRRLTSYIKDRFPDHPPVHGYVRSNSNSLLEWARVPDCGSLQQMAC